MTARPICEPCARAAAKVSAEADGAPAVGYCEHVGAVYALAARGTFTVEATPAQAPRAVRRMARRAPRMFAALEVAE
jgi:hypothetical protein